MQYLTVGKRDFVYDSFRGVEDTDENSLKPVGGVWLTQYNNQYYNEWVEFILDDPVLLVYKNKGSSIWKQPCSLVTLKESANIFNLANQNDLDYLKQRYPLPGDKFSYKAMSSIYDGIFVNMYSLLRDVKDKGTRERLYKFGVNSLNLFNLDCIDYYQSGFVLIDPFDFEFGCVEAPSYEISIDDTKKRILKK